jgi:hypothetical protein
VLMGIAGSELAGVDVAENGADDRTHARTSNRGGAVDE